MIALASASTFTVSHFRANPSFNVDGNSLIVPQNVKRIFELFSKKVILQSKKMLIFRKKVAFTPNHEFRNGKKKRLYPLKMGARGRFWPIFVG